MHFKHVEADAPGEDFHEIVVKHSGSQEREWREGEPFSLLGVPTDLIAGVHYVLQVRATSELGNAIGWGVSSLPVLTPPDFPLKPEPPDSPWQWPYAIELSRVSPWTTGAQLEICRLKCSKSLDMTDPVEIGDKVAVAQFADRFALVEDLECGVGFCYQLCVMTVPILPIDGPQTCLNCTQTSEIGASSSEHLADREF